MKNQCKTGQARHAHASILFFVYFLFISFHCHAYQAPELIKDVNTLPIQRDSLCDAPVSVEGIAFFCGAEFQLWMSDGTSEGTVPVIDASGAIVENPDDLIASGGLLYFTVGYDLWRSDGTPQGTRRLQDAQGRSIEPELMTDVEGELYFFRFNLVHNGSLSFLHELWKTDGTESGTQQVKLFPVRLNPNDTEVVNGTLFFSNYDHQLWKSDGTESGTVLIGDFPGINSRTDHNNLTNVNGTLYFSLQNDSDAFDLWKSDGSSAGTSMVFGNIADRNFTVSNFRNVGGKLFFTEEENYTDTAIWVSNGTPSGTQRLAVLSGRAPEAALATENFYYITLGNRLWRSDGTAAGTLSLASGVDEGFYARPVLHSNRVYFSEENASGAGLELWKTNGELFGTQLVRDIAWQTKSSSPRHFVSIAGGLLFEANKGNHLGGFALWKSDGTASGTQRVKDISQYTYGSYPNGLTAVGNHVFFFANMTRHPFYRQQWELWKTDGTDSGTQAVLNLIEEKTQSNLYFGSEFAYPVAFDGRLYLSGREANGWAMWRTDGSVAGTEKLTALLPGGLQGLAEQLTVYSGNLYFFAPSWHGQGLWRLTPGAGTAVLVAEGLSSPSNLSLQQGKLFFVNDAKELWLSDGTAAGTNRLITMPVAMDAEVDELQSFNDRFIFRVQWNYHYEGFYNDSALWISDSTAAGTYSLKSPYPRTVLTGEKGILYAGFDGVWVSDGSVSGTERISSFINTRHLTDVNGIAYFSVDDQALWMTDWTPAGTRRVTDGIFIVAMEKINDALYFSAYDEAGGGGYFSDSLSLRMSDGTAAGTVVVKPGIYLSRTLETPNGNLFIGFLEGKAEQIWKTDGTESGTMALSNIPTYTDYRFIQFSSHLVVDKRLFIAMDSGMEGSELWLLDLAGNVVNTGVMGDYTWLDLDADGVQDSSETGLAGIHVALEDCSGNPVDSRISDAAGGFLFNHLAAGSYRLQFSLPVGYAFSPRGRGGDYQLDSTVDPATGLIPCKPLAEGQRRTGLDAGFVQIHATGKMGDRVWLDMDRDGVQDTSEPGFANVSVNLEDCSGNVLQMASTNQSGFFLFDQLVDGDYQMRYSAPAGYRFSPENAGIDYRLDSNANPVSGLVPCKTIRNGQGRRALDAGLMVVP